LSRLDPQTFELYKTMGLLMESIRSGWNDISWKRCWKHCLSIRARDPYPLFTHGWRACLKSNPSLENRTPRYVYAVVSSTTSQLKKKWKSKEDFFKQLKIITLVFPRMSINSQRSHNNARTSSCLCRPSSVEAKRIMSSTERSMEIRTWWRRQPSPS